LATLGRIGTLQSFVEKGRVPGIRHVFVDATRVLADDWCGFADLAASRPVEPRTTFMAYSMSKTITAAAVLQLVEAKALALDDPIERYVPSQPYGDRVTVRHLLSHTSGIPNPIPLRWVHPAARHQRFDEAAALDAVLRRHAKLAFAPGTSYRYSNIGYWLLGPIVERAGGRPFTSYVDEQIVQRLAIPREALNYTVVDGDRHASGYLERFTLMNLLKPFLIDRELIGEAIGRWQHIFDHYPNGPAFGGLVGSAGAFARFVQDQLAPRSALFGGAARDLFFEQQHTTSGPVAMTLGWHIGSNAGRTFYFKEGGGGGFHCLMRVYRDAGVGSVVMTNATSFDVHAALDALDARFLSAAGGPAESRAQSPSRGASL
jgi:D-alanyl-D-alanine carboxypeptidase